MLNNKNNFAISLLLDICGKFQAASVGCERGFSLMNSVKTKVRNRLEVDRLDSIKRIKLYLLNGNEIDVGKVYDYWKSKKNRRISQCIQSAKQSTSKSLTPSVTQPTASPSPNSYRMSL